MNEVDPFNFPLRICIFPTNFPTIHSIQHHIATVTFFSVLFSPFPFSSGLANLGKKDHFSCSMTIDRTLSSSMPQTWNSFLFNALQFSIYLPTTQKTGSNQGFETWTGPHSQTGKILNRSFLRFF